MYTIQNIYCHLLPFVILHINAECDRLLMRLKIKKKKIRIKKTKTNRRQQQKLNIIAKLGFKPRPLAWKSKIITTGVLYHMASKHIYKICVQFFVHDISVYDDALVMT